MRIRIVQRPPATIEGVLFERYQVDCVYEVSARLANLLVAHGHVVFEVRERGDDVPPDDDPRRD
jgi:hypothetical protein